MRGSGRKGQENEKINKEKLSKRRKEKRMEKGRDRLQNEKIVLD
jgi:hypothetical protein